MGQGGGQGGGNGAGGVSEHVGAIWLVWAGGQEKTGLIWLVRDAGKGGGDEAGGATRGALVHFGQAWGAKEQQRVGAGQRAVCVGQWFHLLSSLKKVIGLIWLVTRGDGRRLGVGQGGEMGGHQKAVWERLHWPNNWSDLAGELP